MAEKNFSDTLVVREIEAANQDERMGSFTDTAGGELKNIRARIFKHGTLGGSETMQLRVYADENYRNPIAISNTVELADVTTDEYWLGRVRFDFANEILDFNRDYYLAMRVANYTPTTGTNYLSYVFDWPLNINANAAVAERGAVMEIYKED